MTLFVLGLGPGPASTKKKWYGLVSYKRVFKTQFFIEKKSSEQKFLDQMFYNKSHFEKCYLDRCLLSKTFRNQRRKVIQTKIFRTKATKLNISEQKQLEQNHKNKLSLEQKPLVTKVISTKAITNKSEKIRTGLVPVESTRVYVCSRWREKNKVKTLRKNRLHFLKKFFFIFVNYPQKKYSKVIKLVHDWRKCLVMSNARM